MKMGRGREKDFELEGVRNIFLVCTIGTQSRGRVRIFALFLQNRTFGGRLGGQSGTPGGGDLCRGGAILASMSGIPRCKRLCRL